MFSILKNIKLTALIGSLIVGAVFVSTVAMFIVVRYQLLLDGQSAAAERQKQSLRVAATILEPAVPGMVVQWSPAGEVQNVIAEAIPAFSDHTLIDRISRVTGEPATVFIYDAKTDDFIRNTTSVKKADGSRAVGTALGKDSAASGAVRGGQAYIGEAKISRYALPHGISAGQGSDRQGGWHPVCWREEGSDFR